MPVKIPTNRIPTGHNPDKKIPTIKIPTIPTTKKLLNLFKLGECLGRVRVSAWARVWFS